MLEQMTNLMAMTKYYRAVLLSLGLFMLLGCREEMERVFDESPSERISSEELKLSELLQSAPNGWHMVYFPNVDESLSGDALSNIKTGSQALIHYFQRDRLGIGGYNLFLRFKADGGCDMMSDIPEVSDDLGLRLKPRYSSKLLSVGYQVSLGDDLEFNFMTSSPLDCLSSFATNQRVGRFKFTSQDPETGEIRLSTGSYDSPGRELIVMRPIEFSFDDWAGKMERLSEEKERYRNRYFSSNGERERRRCVLQIIATRQNTVVYETEYSFGANIVSLREELARLIAQSQSFTERDLGMISQYDRRQYSLYYKNEEPSKTVGNVDNSKYYTALSSGYAATLDGLYFFPGFNYQGLARFTSFRRTAEKEWTAQEGAYTAKITFVTPTND